MRDLSFSFTVAKREKAGMPLRIISLSLVCMVAYGCAPLMQNLGGGESAKKYQEAAALSEQGKYREAHDAYRELAEKQPASPLAEQARFNAAYMLVYHKNPDKDYAHARLEFEGFLTRYPESRLAGDAASWLEMLRNFEQSGTNEIMREVASLTKKLDDARIQQQETQSARDALLKEQAELTKKIDGLLRDKDVLSQEKASALHENEKLIGEKAVLEKKLDALTKENEKLAASKERLIKAKEKLEKRLRDLSMVDVKLEKKRKKVK